MGHYIPLSFHSMYEGLTALINVAERIGLLRGVVVSRGGTKISYLLFADDCVIYGMAKLSEWQQIQS